MAAKRRKAGRAADITKRVALLRKEIREVYRDCLGKEIAEERIDEALQKHLETMMLDLYPQHVLALAAGIDPINYGVSADEPSDADEDE